MKTKREIRRKRERRKEGKIKKWIRERERGREEREKMRKRVIFGYFEICIYHGNQVTNIELF